MTPSHRPAEIRELVHIAHRENSANLRSSDLDRVLDTIDFQAKMIEADIAALQRNVSGAQETLDSAMETLREFAEDVANQFGYAGMRDGHSVLSTGGLSTLEWAFAILGWDDPHPVPERECEVPTCGPVESTARRVLASVRRPRPSRGSGHAGGGREG